VVCLLVGLLVCDKLSKLGDGFDFGSDFGLSDVGRRAPTYESFGALIGRRRAASGRPRLAGGVWHQ